MTVIELINKLKRLPPDKDVEFESGGYAILITDCFLCGNGHVYIVTTR